MLFSSLVGRMARACGLENRDGPDRPYKFDPRTHRFRFTLDG
jgi:hypothetical protein